MMQSTTASSVPGCAPVRSLFQVRPSFSDCRGVLTTGFAVAALLAAAMSAHAQAVDPAAAAQAESQAAAAQAGSQPAAATQQQPNPDLTFSNQKSRKGRKQKDEKVVQSKDTKQEEKKDKKDYPLQGQDAKLPDKELYDKAEEAIKHGRFDVGRLDLQTLLNTYQDSQYLMRAKLAIADSWYREGGTAALTQAEQEYKDFITFFPNAPEAAEAQMRVGDIYFRQMDKPDRDDTNTVKAEQEYRLMLEQFPDSPLVPQARQRLREVQETLADREANIATFYAQRTPPNLAGAIARYQTVVDTYPLYSHMDEVLIGLGDAYEAEAKEYRTLKLPEAVKARLVSTYDDDAANAYRQVVLEHSATPHVEDAKDRLVGMGLPVPTPTPEEVAASEALENSRGQYTLSKRAIGLFLHQADTVPAATIGAPPLEDPKVTSAALIEKKAQADYVAAFNPQTAAPRVGVPAVAPATTAESNPAPAAAAAPAASAPLALQDVTTDTTGGNSAPTDTNVQLATPSRASSASAGNSGNGMGIEIVHSPSADMAPATAPATPPAFPGTATSGSSSTPAASASTPAGDPPAQAVAPNGGMGPVGPPNSAPLAPVEKATQAPTPINEATQGPQTPTEAAPLKGKKPKVDCDKSTESCSNKKKKKGLGKLNPF